jgi:glucose-1-phosphate adenylyltransferase
LISEGCVIQGRVVNSILSPGVQVGKGSKIVNSIIMHDTVIEPACVIEDTICDKDVHFGRACVCGSGRMAPNRNAPGLLYRGLTVIGKGASIPAGVRIGRNCIIHPDVTESSFPRKTVGSGESIGFEHEKK